MPNTELQLIITARDLATQELEKISGRVKDLQPTFRKMAIAGTAAFGALAIGIRSSINEALKAEEQQIKLTQVLRTSTRATDDQIRSLLDQAAALEKVGVISKDAIVAGQAQLATFDLQAESIKALTPAILNYAAAEKGAGAGAEELKALTNGLAQALQGNFASLTKTGFILDDATKALIENGTETERVAALVRVLDSTYAGVNETMGKEAPGQLIHLQNELSNLKDNIGKALLPALTQLVEIVKPIVERLAKWAEENPETARTIIIVVTALTALIAVVGTLGLILPPLIAGFTLLLSPIGLIILAIAALIAIGVALYQNWDAIKARLQPLADAFSAAWNAIKDVTISVFDSIREKIQSVLDWVMGAIQKIKSAAGAVGGFFQNAGSQVGGLLQFAAGGMVPGPTGQAQLAVVHGGETITPVHGTRATGGGGIVVNISGNSIGSNVDITYLAKKVGDEVMRALRLNQQI